MKLIIELDDFDGDVLLGLKQLSENKDMQEILIPNYSGYRRAFIKNVTKVEEKDNPKG